MINTLFMKYLNEDTAHINMFCPTNPRTAKLEIKHLLHLFLDLQHCLLCN